jgi:hypothetical protein
LPRTIDRLPDVKKQSILFRPTIDPLPILRDRLRLTIDQLSKVKNQLARAIDQSRELKKQSILFRPTIDPWRKYEINSAQQFINCGNL